MIGSPGKGGGTVALAVVKGSGEDDTTRVRPHAARAPGPAPRLPGHVQGIRSRGCACKVPPVLQQLAAACAQGRRCCWRLVGNPETGLGAGMRGESGGGESREAALLAGAEFPRRWLPVKQKDRVLGGAVEMGGLGWHAQAMGSALENSCRVLLCAEMTHTFWCSNSTPLLPAERRRGWPRRWVIHGAHVTTHCGFGGSGLGSRKIQSPTPKIFFRVLCSPPGQGGVVEQVVPCWGNGVGAVECGGAPLSSHRQGFSSHFARVNSRTNLCWN